MKRILLAALVIAALQTNISFASDGRTPAQKRSHDDDQAIARLLLEDLAEHNDCANDAAIAAALAGNEGHAAKRRCARYEQTGDGVDSKDSKGAAVDLTGGGDDVATMAAQQEKIKDLQAKIAAVRQSTIALQAAQALKQDAPKGLWVWSAGLAGSAFGAVRSVLPAWLGGSDTPAPGGLINNGNMCYQNALLRAVYESPLRHMVLDGFCKRVNAGAMMPAYVREFVTTQVALSGDGSIALSDDGSYDPMAFCQAVQAVDPRFSLYRQQDSPEFLETLVDWLQGAGVLPAVPAFADGFHGIRQNEQFNCALCENQYSTKPGYSFSLQLAMPAASRNYSLHELIAHAGAPEVMTGANGVHCATCGGNTVQRKATQFAIHPAQKFIMLHIKRFAHNALTGAITKRSEGITLPENGVLEITDSAGVLHRFKVASVVIHAGMPGFGHYWTVTPRGVYNDHVVTLDGGAAMRTLLTTGIHGSFAGLPGTGYMYFLERV